MNGKVSELVSSRIDQTVANVRAYGDAFYNVMAKPYEAAGDGIKDDTAIFQRIVNDANAEGRRAVYCPHGTYYVTALTNEANIVWFGDNATFTGGYGGTINQMGQFGPSEAEFDELKADVMQRGVNVKSSPYNAKGDGVTDDSAAIQAAIDDVSEAGGGIVCFPPGTYLLASSLSWTAAGITLQGAGVDITIIRDHAELGANRLIFLQGEPEDRIINTEINGITFRNGTATTGSSTPGKDCIRGEYIDGLRVDACKFTEVQGSFGLVVKYAKNVTVEGSIFYRWTYAGMYVLVECENIRVVGNIFDTVLNTTSGQVYTFGSGGEALTEGSYYLKNLWIEDNVFLNNPRWEGIDCHGGENIWIKNNYVENCKTGIMVGMASGFVSLPVLRNVWIEDNTIIQGTGNDDQSGITVNGDGIGIKQGVHVHIKGNSIEGFGGTATNTVGAINLSFLTNVTVEGNEVKNYAQAGVMVYTNVKQAVIKENRMLNARGGATTATICAIYLRSTGLYDVLIEGNVCESDDTTKIAKYFLSASQKSISVQIKNNSVNHVETDVFGGIGNLPVEKSSVPTVNLTQKYGDIIYDNNGMPGWYATAPKIGYGSLEASVIVTVNIDTGSNVATIAASGSGDYKWVPEGMNVKIAGAGAAGADLNARVVKNDGTTLTLNASAGTTVSGANLTYQALTLTAV